MNVPRFRRDPADVRSANDRPVPRAATAAVLLALLAAGACGGASTGPAPANAPPANTPPAATTNNAAPAGSPAPEATWLKGLTPKPVPVAAGQRCYAAVPDGNVGRNKICTVEAVSGNTATLKEEFGQVHQNVPGIVIHPLPDNASVKAGDVVTGIQSSVSHHTLGRVKDTAGGKASLRYWIHPSLMDGQVDYAFPPVSTVAPLAWVIYKEMLGADVRHNLAFLVAIDGDKALLSDATSNMKVVPKSDIVRAYVADKEFKVGDSVQAWSFGIGFKPGTVTAVVEPGMLYKVKMTLVAKEEEVDVPFSQLVSSI